MMYVIFITMTVIVSLSLKYSGKDLNIGYEVGMPTSTPSVCVPSPAEAAVVVAGVVIKPAVPANNCDNLAYDMCNSTSCQGMWAVYRLTFSLAGFFLMMLLLTCTKTSFSTTMHRGFWFGKGLGLTGVVIACLFLVRWKCLIQLRSRIMLRMAHTIGVASCAGSLYFTRCCSW
jgi:hypothetical protein